MVGRASHTIFCAWYYRSESIFHPQSRSDAKMISYYGAQAAFQTYRSAVQRLSALTHMGPNYLAFECIRRLSNVLKWLAKSLPTIWQVRLVFDTNTHRVASPILRFQTFLAVLYVLCL